MKNSPFFPEGCPCWDVELDTPVLPFAVLVRPPLDPYFVTFGVYAILEGRRTQSPTQLVHILIEL
jgi:hypothetical protein